MKFFFPDSQDMVSPTYDFINDEYSPFRVRQRDDKYAHEVLSPAPYDGILVSKAIVDGSMKGAGKYSLPQRERLYRLGIKKYFRLPDGVKSLGDCGAFNYIDEEIPPYTVDEVLDFYEGCGFDAGISVDHIIFGYDADISDADVNPAWVERRQISLSYAEKFLAAVESRGRNIEPVGSAQGWSPASYADSVQRLQQMGYQRIALGGMVPLKTDEILACLEEIDGVRDPGTEFHLLGITRVTSMEKFARLGVTSFDSTSPFKQAFMDDRDNYHTAYDTFPAIRVQQSDGNPALKRRILSGAVCQNTVKAAERECLKQLRAFDKDAASVEEVLSALAEYEPLVDPKKKSRLPGYRRTLEAKPWKSCRCTLCQKHGIEIVIFRGTERNKSRGFHNLSVLSERMHNIAVRPSVKER
ncbi:tRNA-guanine transglycosylase DpdA [Nocardia sp. AB354]|uniref:tRNA-guanine transglycosylase DpdA n=1 Tax=Nocardia sp. AB354 TaxID=3413283 RepID=UPI003C1BFE71